MGRHIPSELQILTLTEREALRNKLGLPEARPLVISVGAINKHHKRMDYVISEIASLPEPRPFLLLLGQQYPESSEILNLGNRLLGSESFQIRTVRLTMHLSVIFAIALCIIALVGRNCAQSM